MSLKPNHVITGLVQSGEVAVCDTVRIHSPKSYIDAIVRGIEVERNIITKAKKGEDVAMMFNNLNIIEISDGYYIKKDDLSPGAISLSITESPKQWWQFWR